LLGLIGPVTGGIGTGVAVMTGGSLPPPALLLELDVVAGGNGIGVAVAVTGGSLPPDWGWSGMVPAWPLLELVAFMPPDWELAFIPPDWDWIGLGINSPPPTTLGLPPPLPLLELVAFVPPDWELVAEAEVAIGPVGIRACVGFATTGEVGSGCFSGRFASPRGCFTAGFMTRAVWPLAFSRASAGVLCSAVVASMAAPSANATDGVRILKSVIVMLLSVPGRGAIRRH
jgi:hypothetical protein